MDENGTPGWEAQTLRRWVLESPFLLPFRPAHVPEALGTPTAFADFFSHYERLRARQTRRWRLGLLFEDAVHALLLASPDVSHVDRGVQVLPTGELDFLVTLRDHPEYLLHLETAVKFYFCRDVGGSNDPDRFVGPERRDTLGKKWRKMKDEQLRRLDDFPANRALIPITPEVRVESVPFVKGMLFYPWAESRAEYLPAHPTFVSPAHARGIYLSRCQWPTYLETLRDPHYPEEREIRRLEKTDWVLSEISTKRIFGADDLPALGAPPVAFAVVDSQSNPIERGFVVPDDWNDDPQEGDA